MLNTFMKQTFNAELTEGEHTSKLTSWEYKPHENDNSKDYIRMVFTSENCGKQQEFVRNLFERDVTIAISHLRRQLNRVNEDIVPSDFLDELVSAETPFSFWISYPTVATKKGMQRRQNIHFLAPTETVNAPSEPMEVPV